MSDLPVPELKESGEKLQQAIVLTRMRLKDVPQSRIRMRAVRTLDYSQKLFGHVTQAVMATSSLTGFLHKAAGLSVDDLLAMTGYERLARGATYAGMAAVNDAVRRAIDELAAVNAALDEEGMKNGKNT